MRKVLTQLLLALGIGAVLLALNHPALGQRISDVRGTKHNLSSAASGSNYTYFVPGSATPQTGTVPSRNVTSAEAQVCVFCHTPHAADVSALGGQMNAPLWNRRMSTATYTAYTSSTYDANVIQATLDQPGGTSKLCLSCHDGTLAIGQVNVLANQLNVTIPMTGTDPTSDTGFPQDVVGGMPDGSGKTSGFTRDLGIDLSNDHPIAFNFTKQVGDRDGEIRVLTDGLPPTGQKWNPGSGPDIIGVRASGYRPVLPLEATGSGGVGQMQCGTCHDPHLRDTAAAAGNQKFLRQNRFNEQNPPSATYNAATDQICVSCHERNLGIGVWSFSAHAHVDVADETYTETTLRDFPAGLTVARAGCVNCHDTHAVQGTRRLLREGTNSTTTPKTGGNPALEQTCYQCHTTNSTVISGTATAQPAGPTTVPRIQYLFEGTNRRMPIATDPEVHEISSTFNDVGFVDCSGAANYTAQCGKDHLESRARLGFGGVAGLTNRHAECTDCHNPHRVIKAQTAFVGTPTRANTSAKAGTHRHEDVTGYTHNNLISGVLRGSWGVNPKTYVATNVSTSTTQSSNSFHSMPSDFDIKRGDPGATAVTTATAPTAVTFVTREYQICLKCHSNYAYEDNNLYPNSSLRPQLGRAGATPANPNGHANFTSYTNQAKEFQAPATHRPTAPANGTCTGYNLGQDAGADPIFNNCNHRSWHPVMDFTNRTATYRGNGTNIAANWRLPWSNAVGTQTMYCSDCHGPPTAATTVMPLGNNNVFPGASTDENGEAWGPHGSSNNFILKGPWDTNSGSTDTNALCFRCHQQEVYATTGGGGRTGFWINRSSRAGNDGHVIHSGRDKLPNIKCNWCHVAVPHGWKNKALLINLNDVGPEAGFTTANGLNGNTKGTGNRVATPYNNGPYYRNAMLKVKNFAASGNWAIEDCGDVTNADSRDWMRTSCNNPP